MAAPAGIGARRRGGCLPLPRLPVKAQLRQIYRVDCDWAIGVLEAWLKWTWRSRLAPFVKLARTIRDQRAGIEAAFQKRLNNVRVEQINTQIRLITRRGFGYPSQDAVIALAMLSLGELCPPNLGG
jgi:transposase